MTKKRLLVIIAISVTFLIFAGGEPVYCEKQDQNQVKETLGTFRNRPITEGICNQTAHTLNQGEWKVGDLSFPGQFSQWKYFYLQYGLTENLQIGTTLAQNFLGGPNLSGKYHLPIKGPAGAELAIPASLNIYLSPIANASFGSGIVASWNLTPKFGFHGGTDLWFNTSGTFSPSAFVMTDYNILSNTKLISELKLYTFSKDVLSLRAGGLVRPFDFLNLKLSSSFDLPSGDMSAWVSLFVRF